MYSEATLKSLSNDIQFFKGVLSTVLSEKNNAQNNIEESKNWLNKQPTYLMFLQNLQNALHQKNLGAFSQLLSYFVKDVLGKDKDIIFDLYTFRNLPALKIESLNDGCREDIYEGNGGSIANIVSTGLRLIVLSRLKNRKFIILDEPDCWLKPNHVTSFAKIIGEISEKLKIQTVIISHHDWNYFKDYGRVVRLATDGKNLFSEIIHDTPAQDCNDIIASVKLSHYMSHEDTSFELHPYLTCIVGDNDIGKSVLSSAIRSVCYGESSDSVIKHHTNEAQVLISLSNGKNILWQRFKSTNIDNPQKVKYSLFNGNELISSEYNSSDTPIFISNELNIVKTEDLDVQIGNQKQPVFLISNDIKPNDRAKILSLGKESILIQKMMEGIKQKARYYNQMLKEAEINFEKFSRIESILVDNESLEDKINRLNVDLTIINKGSQNIANISEFIIGYDSVDKTQNINLVDYSLSIPKIVNTEKLKELVVDIKNCTETMKIVQLNTELTPPILSQTSEVEKCIKRLGLSHAGSSIPNLSLTIEEPNLTNVAQVIDTINNLSINEKYLNLVHLNTNNVNRPIFNDIESLDNLINEIITTNKYSVKLINDRNSNNSILDKSKIEIDNYLKTNDLCPTCNQKINIDLLVKGK